MIGYGAFLAYHWEPPVPSLFVVTNGDIQPHGQSDTLFEGC